jgi:hypothetical protein
MALFRARQCGSTSMARPEVTGRKFSSGIATADIPAAGIGHNGGPPLEYWLELQRIISLKEAARLCGLSVDTIKRRHADKIIALSPRRLGMRIGIALSLSL